MWPKCSNVVAVVAVEMKNEKTIALKSLKSDKKKFFLDKKPKIMITRRKKMRFANQIDVSAPNRIKFSW